jgi:hypothetical protein
VVTDDLHKKGLIVTPPEQFDPPVIPSDFIVARKVLITTAKGLLYNETAVPVRGFIDNIPPVKSTKTPVGINVFRGMDTEVVRLLDKKDDSLAGFFYSQMHMAYAVLPEAIERSDVSAKLTLRSGQERETVELRGPAEFHHNNQRQEIDGTQKSDIELIMLALRGKSEILGGDIMVVEKFSDRNYFSKGQIDWKDDHTGNSEIDLYVEIYTPSDKLSNDKALTAKGVTDSRESVGQLKKGTLTIPFVATSGLCAATDERALYNEAETRIEAIIESLEMRITGSHEPEKRGLAAAN